jgi:hypothetical protein
MNMKNQAGLWTKRRSTKAFTSLALALAFLLFPMGALASNEGDVRSAVESVFQSLKNKNYESLYETLPSGTRSRISKERFASSLRRTQDNYALDRMDVGKVKVAGDFAVVDTVLYGRLLQPLSLEGKIVVQQYLVREGGKWKMATGDDATIQRFLKANPTFARQFSINKPKVFVKKDGKWVEFTPPSRTRPK